MRVLLPSVLIAVVHGVTASPAVSKPAWPPTWNMSLSTMTFPDGNHSGFDNPARAAIEARYGLLSFGWEMRVCLTAVPSVPRSLCTHSAAEWSLDEQARRIKLLNPHTRVLLYRNTELGLSPYHDQCEKMYDPSYLGFWLRDKHTGAILNEPAAPGSLLPCPPNINVSRDLLQDQYFTDFRNSSAREFFVDVVVGRVANSTHADGVWFDDTGGVGQEHPDVIKHFRKKEIAEIKGNTTIALERAEELLVQSGKWSYHLFEGLPVLKGPSPVECVTAVLLGAKMGATNAPAVMTIPYVPEPSSRGCVTGPGGVADEGGVLELACSPGSGAMHVDFASYGTPVVNQTGRFISSMGGKHGIRVYWEDLVTSVLFYVEEWGKDCAVCVDCAEMGCCTVKVSDSYIDSKTLSSQTFGCDVLHNCTAFAANVSCDGGTPVMKAVKELCEGRPSCSIHATGSTLGIRDPCPGTHKSLAVRTSGCSSAAGRTVDPFSQNLALFLIGRGEYSWMGHGWISTKPPLWYPEWSLDYGVPLGQMTRNDGNVFSRRWSQCDVSLDCDTFEATFSWG